MAAQGTPPDDSAISSPERILSAAEKLFADNGFSAVSLRKVTSAAGVNLAAVSYHFGSKDGLIEAVLRRNIEPINEERLRLLDLYESEKSGAMEPGDSVVVPLDTDRLPQLAQWSAVTQIIYNLAIAVAAVNSF